MSMVLGWSRPRKLRETQEARVRLEREVRQISRDVSQKSAVARYSATRLERAAVALMERHNQGMIEAATELRRK